MSVLPTVMFWLGITAIVLLVASTFLMVSKRKNRASAGRWLMAFAFGALWSTVLIDYALTGSLIDLATALVITAAVVFGAVARLRGWAEHE